MGVSEHLRTMLESQSYSSQTPRPHQESHSHHICHSLSAGTRGGGTHERLQQESPHFSHSQPLLHFPHINQPHTLTTFTSPDLGKEEGPVGVSLSKVPGGMAQPQLPGFRRRPLVLGQLNNNSNTTNNSGTSNTTATTCELIV